MLLRRIASKTCLLFSRGKQMKSSFRLILLSLCIFVSTFGSEKKCNPCECFLNFFSCCLNSVRPEECSYFFQNGNDSCFITTENHKPIFLAIQTGNLQEVKKFLKEKEFILHPGAPVGHASAFYDQKEILEYFLERDLKKNEPGFLGYYEVGSTINEAPKMTPIELNKFATMFKCSKRIRKLLKEQPE